MIVAPKHHGVTLSFVVVPNAANVGVAAVGMPNPVALNYLGGWCDGDIAGFHGLAGGGVGRAVHITEGVFNTKKVKLPFNEVTVAENTPAIRAGRSGMGGIGVSLIGRTAKYLAIALVTVERPVGGGDEDIINAILAAKTVPVRQERQELCVVAGVKRQGEANLLLIGNAIDL